MRRTVFTTWLLNACVLCVSSLEIPIVLFSSVCVSHSFVHCSCPFFLSHLLNFLVLKKTKQKINYRFRFAICHVEVAWEGGNVGR